MSETTTERQITYFDVSIAGAPAGRVVFQLYNDLVPKTAENFRPSTFPFIHSFHSPLILSWQAHSALAKRASASPESPYGTKTVAFTVLSRSAQLSQHIDNDLDF